jgi:serine/threonine-protein kinase RsbT
MPPADRAPEKAPLTPRAPLSPAVERGPASSSRSPIMNDTELPASLSGFALEVYRELSLHLSQPNCRVIIATCASAAGVAPSALKATHLALVAAQIERTFDVFGVQPDLKLRCLTNLRALARRDDRSEISIPINQESDIVTARTAGKDMTRDLGFPEVAYVKVATAISELARNILKYAGRGQVTLRRLTGARAGIEAVATDQGPGIADVDLVLSPKFRSKSGMGVGLRGTRRLMDHFEVTSQVGSGTTVVIRKYKD